MNATTQNTHLEALNGTSTGAASVAKNVRKDLKKNFSDVKFSVRKRGYDSLTVSWTDGPSSKTVRELLDKFVTGAGSLCGSYFDSTSTDFTNTYGGVKHMSFSRDLSDEILEQVIAELNEEHSAAEPVTLEQYKSGEARNISPIGNWNNIPHWSWEQIIDRQLSE